MRLAAYHWFLGLRFERLCFRKREFSLLVGVVWDAPLSAGEEERDEVSEVARITRDLKK